LTAQLTRGQHESQERVDERVRKREWVWVHANLLNYRSGLTNSVLLTKWWAHGFYRRLKKKLKIRQK
jgi:hypothetical protein